MPIIVEHSGYDMESDNQRKRLDTDLLTSVEFSNLVVKMPHLRITRSRFSSSPPKKSWPRLIAATYNKNPVDAFSGNFDKPMTCNIRCGNIVLSFDEYVNFRHEPENECQIDLDKYFSLDDISKIESLEIADNELEGPNIAGPDTVKLTT